MGSEGPKAVTIHINGFKKFQGIAENPTETVVNNLKAYVERRGLPAGVTLGSSTVLEAAGDGALPTLLKTLESSISQTNTNNEQVIWVSFVLQLHLVLKIANILEFKCNIGKEILTHFFSFEWLISLLRAAMFRPVNWDTNSTTRLLKPNSKGNKNP